MPFKPGESGNPNGRRPMPKEIREIKRALSEDFILSVNKFFNMNQAELKEVLNNPDSSLLDLSIAQILVKGVKGGDQRRMQFFLEYLVQKIPIKHEVEGSGMQAAQVVLNLQSNGRETKQD